MVQAGTNDQIRSMLDRHPPERLSVSDWESLDRTMRRQREKWGAMATAWWFDSGREYWAAVARENDRHGSVGVAQ